MVCPSLQRVVQVTCTKTKMKICIEVLKLIYAYLDQNVHFHICRTSNSLFGHF
jgi:hypothetical protein